MSATGSIMSEIGIEMGSGYLLVPSPPTAVTARILDPDQRRAPTALTVIVAGGYPGGAVTFKYDGGSTYYTATLDGSGALAATSIPVPPTMMSGSHTLTVSVTTTSVPTSPDDVATVDLAFTLRNNPSTGHVVGPDADPLEIVGATQADGHRHWVFQDLMPGGLGSYVFPHNPPTSTRPDFERALTARRSTANDGQVHVSEGTGTAYTWTIAGVCFTQAEQEALEAWADLNRRFYVIDDFDEAWTVAATGVAITPRKRALLQVVGEPSAITDWVAEYTFTMLVYIPDALTPVP